MLEKEYIYIYIYIYIIAARIFDPSPVMMKKALMPQIIMEDVSTFFPQIMKFVWIGFMVYQPLLVI